MDHDEMIESLYASVGRAESMRTHLTAAITAAERLDAFATLASVDSAINEFEFLNARLLRIRLEVQQDANRLAPEKVR